MIKKLVLFILFLNSFLYSFQADCTLEDSSHFHFSLESNIMIVDWKYKVFYKGNFSKWEHFENEGYIYKIKEPYKDGFSIKVKNKKYTSFKNGTCVR